jgi:hypothetical protein
MYHSEKSLHIDIPVKLAEVKAVFSIGALVFEGDLPASIFHMQLIENDASHWKAKTDIDGVRIELCGATAKVHHWGNADLLHGIKVNTDAMARTVQLVQEGFVKITERIDAAGAVRAGRS